MSELEQLQTENKKLKAQVLDMQTDIEALLDYIQSLRNDLMIWTESMRTAYQLTDYAGKHDPR